MQDDGHDANRLESLALTLIFTGLSLALLSALFLATRHGPATGGWWTRPWLAPGVALTVLVGANLLTLGRAWSDLRAAPTSAAERADAWEKIIGWLRPLEHLAYFSAYLFAIQHLGYVPSTLLFVMFLLWRTGMTDRHWILAGTGFVIGMMLVFRVGLGVWMPAPAFYDVFPDALRIALIRWF
ncbi:MAG: tripartite tricarboxylate transporter TctB family protein [Gemmobacter sp.]